MTGRRASRRLIFRSPALALASIAALLAVGVGPSNPVHANEGTANGSAPAVEVLSSRADAVTGTEALVRLTVPPGLKSKVRVTLQGHDVTSAFGQSVNNVVADKNELVGLLNGLSSGANSIKLWGPGGNRPLATLELVSHPVSGPIFSGPHQTPFVCTTELAGLGSPVDSDCSASPNEQFFYWSITAGDFVPLDDPEKAPDDVARITTRDGNDIQYIVRVEAGTVNRHIYWFATLYNPANPPQTRVLGPWNEQLVYYFGGGCGAGYNQGTESPSTVLQDTALRRGYAVVHATNNTAGQNCNDVLSAETATMLKERFIEQIGLPDHTVGLGASGGAFQQRLIAQNYPGILDGLILQLPFPDTTTINQRGLDCSLLEQYFDDGDPSRWTVGKQAAVAGYAMDENGNTLCDTIHPRLGQDKVDPTVGFNSVIPNELRYDPDSNPDGARATIADNMVNVYGIDATTGFARTSFDNVGVQYGFKALNDGVIGVDEFLDVNEGVGGYGVDGDIIEPRSVGNLEAIRREYSTGRVVRGDTLALPMIEVRKYEDFDAGLHDRIWTFAMKERMLRDKGHAGNLVSWTYPGNLNEADFVGLALEEMSDWLNAVSVDSHNDRRYEKDVLRSKPSGLVDGCWTPTGERIDEEAVLKAESSQCNALFPTHEMPRMVAGGPVTNDTFKCVLKPLDLADYEVQFTENQIVRLREIFPEGVCDWSVPSMGEVGFDGTWQSYGF